MTPTSAYLNDLTTHFDDVTSYLNDVKLTYLAPYLPNSNTDF